MTTAGQANSKSSVQTQSVATAAQHGNQIHLCDGGDDDDDEDYDDYDDDGAADKSFRLSEEDYVDIDDDDKMAGIVGSLGNQQDHEANDNPAARIAREAREALIQASMTRWRTRIDGNIADARETLAVLGEHGLLDFKRHHLRQDETKLTQQQVEEFWALPGVAQSLGHLRYEGPDELIGTFDTGKWNDPIHLLKNTCPYDSAIAETHRMLCADADLLLLLQQRADNDQAAARERDATNTILDMHRFASARMWDAARLVIVRHALFVGNVYDHFVPSTFLSDAVLNLTASVNYVDRLFSLAGASIGGFVLVRKAACDHEECELNHPHIENLVDSSIVFEVRGPASFQDRLTHWFSVPKERCKKTIGSVSTKCRNSCVLGVKYSIHLIACSF